MLKDGGRLAVPEEANFRRGAVSTAGAATAVGSGRAFAAAAVAAAAGVVLITGRMPVPGAAGCRGETIVFPVDFLLTKCALGGPCSGTPVSLEMLQ